MFDVQANVIAAIEVALQCCRVC